MTRIIRLFTPRISRRQLALQFAFVATYVAANLIWRWLRWPLFSGHGAFGWPQPDTLDLVQLIAVNLTPVWVIAYLMYRALAWRPRMSVNLCTLAALLIGLLTIELDDAWYAMSGRHVRWTDVEIFLTENWAQHFGVQQGDIERTLARMGVHAIALWASLILSSWLADRRIPSLDTPWAGGRLASLLGVLFVLDLGATGAHLARGDAQWIAVLDRNPLRIALVPRVLEAFSVARQDIAAVNADFEALPRTPLPTMREMALRGADSGTDAAARPDVLLVVVEGFNVNLVTPETMPFFHRFAARSTVGARNYSTGNITAYGILGLVFGEPLAFYAGSRRDLASGSRYIDTFNRNGYRSRQITDPLTDYRHMGEYLFNFSEAPIESEDHWELLPEIVSELGHEQPSFVLSYYYGTHFPYHHRSDFDHFQPEVPEGYDYSGWNAQNDRLRISNRYRNCLLEADAWFQELVESIDLERTIVVVTGDHGEEFYETNRLGHASTLGEAQIRVPLVFFSPGHEPAIVDRITSHLDVLPTVFDDLGWEAPDTRYGVSLRAPARSGAAFVARSNGRRLPDTWAIVTETGKSVVRFRPGHGLSFVELLDEDERAVSYRDAPNGWRRNLVLGQMLEEDLLEARSR